MDFDFTDDQGDGTEVEVLEPHGIYITVSDGDSFASDNLTPARARLIADALNTCADHMEDNK